MKPLLPLLLVGSFYSANSMNKTTLSLHEPTPKTSATRKADRTGKLIELELFEAIQQHNHNAVKALIPQASTLNIRDSFGFSLLETAYCFSQWDTVLLLLNNNANINIESNAPILCRAAGKGKVEHVAELLNRGADIHATTSEERTALDEALS